MKSSVRPASDRKDIPPAKRARAGNAAAEATLRITDDMTVSQLKDECRLCGIHGFQTNQRTGCYTSSVLELSGKVPRHLHPQTTRISTTMMPYLHMSVRPFVTRIITIARLFNRLVRPVLNYNVNVSCDLYQTSTQDIDRQQWKQEDQD
mmetsp:Transcript_30717/g.74379  ORF Transcript_30717/g.74379 Transcript_30717/m.74379 type:complete len:149 (-) Transcript_30717:116-562(-)